MARRLAYSRVKESLIRSRLAYSRTQGNYSTYSVYYNVHSTAQWVKFVLTFLTLNFVFGISQSFHIKRHTSWGFVLEGRMHQV